MEILKTVLLSLQALISVVLVVIVTLQTTKSEGLTGSIGGQVTPSFKGKPGIEDQVRMWTIYISIAWFVLSILVAMVVARAS